MTSHLFVNKPLISIYLFSANVHHEPKTPEAVQTGLLVAEPYSWKSLISGNPILRLRGSGVRAAVLVLPPGCVSTAILFVIVYDCDVIVLTRDVLQASRAAFWHVCSSWLPHPPVLVDALRVRG